MENLKEIEKIRCHPTIIIEKLMTVIIASIAVEIAFIGNLEELLSAGKIGRAHV